jgi:hypothetical protein
MLVKFSLAALLLLLLESSGAFNGEKIVVLIIQIEQFDKNVDM